MKRRVQVFDRSEILKELKVRALRKDWYGFHTVKLGRYLSKKVAQFNRGKVDKKTLVETPLIHEYWRWVRWLKWIEFEAGTSKDFSNKFKYEDVSEIFD